MSFFFILLCTYCQSFTNTYTLGGIAKLNMSACFSNKQYYFTLSSAIYEKSLFFLSIVNSRYYLFNFLKSIRWKCHLVYVFPFSIFWLLVRLCIKSILYLFCELPILQFTYFLLGHMSFLKLLKLNYLNFSDKLVTKTITLTGIYEFICVFLLIFQ